MFALGIEAGGLVDRLSGVLRIEGAGFLAREGGLGVVHKNFTPEEQAREVQKVKRAESGMILDPVTIEPSKSLREAFETMRSGQCGKVLLNWDEG